MKIEVDLLAIERGSISAPAGCGKTHVIASALARHSGPKPILVLTHTNAGVVALRSRLDAARVAPSAYRLSTLDGWAMRLIRTFPGRSGHDPAVLEIKNPGTDYHEIRRRAAQLLNSGHIADVLRCSYDRLIVDEYQDCLQLQHAIVGLASNTLRTCVLGDPLQAIFGFAGKLVHWDNDVRRHFPHQAELNTPWRWINAGEAAFGEWLLDVRRRLMVRQSIDIRAAPANVSWVALDGNSDRAKRLEACKVEGPMQGDRILIIGNSRSPQDQQAFASETPGATTVEGVDLKDLVNFARSFHPHRAGALVRVGQFADLVMSGADGAGQTERFQSRGGLASQTPSAVELSCAAFLSKPSYRGAVDLLVELQMQGGVRVHRPSVLACCVKALNASSDAKAGAFQEAAIRAREENRVLGRAVPTRAVGSTLLLKGLEAEVCVVLQTEGMDAAHLYVAMTRGSKKLLVCSRQPVLADADFV